ncbi:hypothetical protein Asi03nite_24210 [Actinoplanes siamensis]|uniref:Uncharacterized protein n=1 Tax=Actinoplanes siamensis TaxID=1223317 RepID=A0A919TJY6_9ACTN|nr:hypothetical protein Asi03nite_24210 [Actinoplanes siamensis]
MASWIWVTDWNSEIAKPTASAVSSTGADSFAAIVMACSPSSTTIVSVMPISSGASRGRGVRTGGRTVAVGFTAPQSSSGPPPCRAGDAGQGCDGGSGQETLRAWGRLRRKRGRREGKEADHERERARADK